jgi:translation initiation factor IF-2
MAKRLIKIAKELNVGLATIVDHLNEKGFEVENRPTFKISDEMYQELLVSFESSIAVKEKADQMVIGTRSGKTDTKPEETADAKKVSADKEETPKPEEKVAEKKTETSKPQEKAKEPEEIIDKKEVDKKVEEKKKIGPKVVGKIDLDKPKKKKAKITKKAEDKKKEEKTEKTLKTQKKVEKPQEIQATDKEKPAEESPSKSKEDLKKEKNTEAQKSETVKAEAPQLKGLKVLGKIDTDKLKKKKPKSTPKPVAKKSDEDQPAKKKRKRIRRKIKPKQKSSKGGQKSKKDQKDEVQEITQKEIEEKIKATLARIGGGSKKKRQKIRRDKRDQMKEKQELIEESKETGKIELTEFISVKEFASLLNVPVTDVITTCMNLGVIVSINQRLDAEIIELVADEFDKEIEFISAEEQVDEEIEIEDNEEDLKPRSPIVTVMGHVDHGKTSLLDYIREANVAGGEAGGITQHIGAYEVKVGEQNQKITFLDTPGHEAFTAMRARGAKVTDIAVIIIAADDKIMPQTKEAISHAQAAGVPIIFAINKIDKAGAQPDRIKNELAEMNLMVEEWGGKYQSQDISAKNGTNIEELLEKILLEAEILELKANPDRPAISTVLDASLDKGRGYVTNILVQTGTLKIGDPIYAGEFSGKVKAMFDGRGKRIKKAGPSTPLMLLGLSGAPQAGESLKVSSSDQEARSIANKRAQIIREQSNRASKRISLDEIGRRLALGTFKELNLIIKGDVDGSVEALADSLIKLSVETIQVNVIHKGVGQIIESDVLLASASDAIIIGFQVRPSSNARKLAEKEGIEIKTYSIIYKAIEEIKMAMEGMLEPTKEENIVGQVEIRETYKISKVGTIAGCYVQEGKITRNSHIRLIREGIVIYPTKEGQHGEIGSLKRFKDDVKEVKSGMECGLNIQNFNDIKVGDIIEVYEIVEVKQTLE